MKYIDIHCHLDFLDFDKDREEVIGRMKEAEVGAITIGTDIESSKKALGIAEKNENIWACVGVHPTSPPTPSQREGEQTLTKGEGREGPLLEKFIASPKVVAIGECGLDFFRIEPDRLSEERKKQREIFEMQIELGIKHKKALMLHCRETYDEVLDILSSYKNDVGEKLFGNAHFFAGNISQAKKFIDLEFTLSFTGVITFTRNYDEVIRYVPQTSIMSETDAPFVAPVPYRGKRNEPSFVVEVVKKLAEIRDEDVESLKESIILNAQKLFGI